MSASTVSKPSSSDPTIMLRWPVAPESPGVTLDAARLRLEVIAETHSGNGPISLQHRREGKDKEPYEYLNCNFPRFLQLTFFFLWRGGGGAKRRAIQDVNTLRP